MRDPNILNAVAAPAGESLWPSRGNEPEQINVPQGNWETVRRGIRLMTTSLKAIALTGVAAALCLLFVALVALCHRSTVGGENIAFDIDGLVKFLAVVGVASLGLGVGFVSYLIGVGRSLAAPAAVGLGRFRLVCQRGFVGGFLLIALAISVAAVRGAVRIWSVRLAIGVLTLTGSLILAGGCCAYCLYLAVVAGRFGGTRLRQAFQGFAATWALTLAIPAVTLEVGIFNPVWPPHFHLATTFLTGAELVVAPCLGIWWASLLWLLHKRLSEPNSSMRSA